MSGPPGYPVPADDPPAFLDLSTHVQAPDADLGGAARHGAGSNKQLSPNS
jgi:hypothetical protein